VGCVTGEICLKAFYGLRECAEILQSLLAARGFNSGEEPVSDSISSEAGVLIRDVFSPAEPFSAQDLVYLFPSHVDQRSYDGELLGPERQLHHWLEACEAL
jgi:hypothetical protein